MDPITAVGFAASIITFIDFSHKIISGTSEVLSSGGTLENAHVSVLIDDLREATKDFDNRPPGYSHHDDALNTLASECQGICDELCGLLGKLKVQVGTSRWQSVKVALRSMRKRGEVAYLEERLGKCRSQIMLRLVLLLNEDKLSIQIQLKDAQSQSQKQASDVMKQLTHLRDDVLKTLQGADQHSHDLVSAEVSQQIGLAREVRTALNDLLATSAIPSPEMRILRQLYFSTLYAREDKVTKAEDGTFEWLLSDDSMTAGNDGVNEDDYDEDDYDEDHNDEGDDDEGDDDEDDYDEDDYDEEATEYCRALEKDTTQIRLESRLALLGWLRSGEGVFHISGKAGSGKSTLMKFLLDHPRTRVELNKWAGSKQLLFAHFFFWRAGDELQRSLDGLYRSILFELLKQSPELIRETFPEAYEAFSRNGPAMSFDGIHFRPGHLGRAMEALIAKSPYPGHSICLFIDGLDEYGEDGTDSLDHEKLAEQLQSWAAKDGVKILVSSRPHQEFEQAFPDHRRIRLHKLTELDIFRFTYNMFKRDKHYAKNRNNYLGLAKTVVRYSRGVFLWARLAVRSLIMATRRNSTIEYLEKQLEHIPKDLDNLYKQLFESISDADRTTAIKLLLLVAEASQVWGGLNAIAMTWIDSLDDETFPMSREIQPYTDSEIRKRHSAAESRLDDLTKGLLEMSDCKDTAALFFSKEITFFHRTLRDFVLGNEHIEGFLKRFPGFPGREMGSRLYLADFWFAKTEHLVQLGRHKVGAYLNWFPQGEPGHVYRDALDRAVAWHAASGLDDISGVLRGFTVHSKMAVWGGYQNVTEGRLSMVHWAAFQDVDLDYVRRTLATKPDIIHAQGNLSLLVSASWNEHEGNPLLRILLDLGASPNERVEVEIDEAASPTSPRTTIPATPWMIFCVSFAAIVEKEDFGGTEKLRRKLGSRLEDFLATGKVDTNCLVLLSAPSTERIRPLRRTATHCIHFRHLVAQLELPNHERLMALMGGSEKTTWRSVFGGWWNHATASRTGHDDQLSTQASLYLPFHVGMPTPQEDYFSVESVKWADAELTGKGGVYYVRVC